MRLKLLFLALFLLGTSAAYAGTGGSCADCYGAGAADPSGVITSLSSHCYWQPSGKYGSCLPRELSNSCITSTASYCPNTNQYCDVNVSCDPGGGYGGSGGGGSDCSPGGYCDPSCFDCLGGGMLY